MRLLLTRPRPDSEKVARELAARGIGVVIAPVIEIVPVAFEPPGAGAHQAILLTSANAVAALAEAEIDPNTPVYCVGDATAERVSGLGFTSVRSAAGAAADLAALVRDTRSPDQGPLLHLGGATIAGDLDGVLSAAGFILERRVVYQAETVSHLPEAAVTALRDGALDGVLLYSPRTARTLVALMTAAGQAAAAGAMTAYCLSPAVAEAAGGLAWRKVAVAARPNQLDLLALLPN